MNTEELNLICNYYKSFEVDKILSILDLADINVYSSVKYAELFGLTPADLFGKNLDEFTQNTNAMLMVNIGRKYFKMLHASKSNYVTAVLKWTTPNGSRIFQVELCKINSRYHKLEFIDMRPSFITDVLHVINQISGTKKYQKKVINQNEFKVQEKYQINEEEEIVIFLLSIGKSYKEIANILTGLYKLEFTDMKIKRMIYNNLFSRFDVFNINELVTAYLILSSTHSIPAKLISMTNYTGILTANYSKS